MFSPVQQKLWAAELTAASALLSIFSSFKPRERTKAGSWAAAEVMRTEACSTGVCALNNECTAAVYDGVLLDGGNKNPCSCSEQPCTLPAVCPQTAVTDWLQATPFLHCSSVYHKMETTVWLEFARRHTEIYGVRQKNSMKNCLFNKILQQHNIGQWQTCFQLRGFVTLPE